jgi:hypothetical protein
VPLISDHAPFMSIPERSDWLTVEVAAARLGVSPSTIKRRIQDRKPVKLAHGGSVELEPEMIERPQGHEWRVRIVGALPAISSDPERTDSEEAPAISSVQDRPDIATGLLERLSAQDAVLGEQRAEIARINAENADLREDRGRLQAERESIAEALLWTQAQLDRERGELERLRGRSFWDWLRGR